MNFDELDKMGVDLETTTGRKQAAQHTPGPWEWAKAKSGITFDEEGAVYPPDSDITGGYQYSGPIAVVAVHADAGGEANGHLIAAAPEMLEALEDISTGLLPMAEVVKIHAAIAKAKGESQ